MENNRTKDSGSETNHSTAIHKYDLLVLRRLKTEKTPTKIKNHRESLP
jgi:hypothetical protein